MYQHSLALGVSPRVVPQLAAQRSALHALMGRASSCLRGLAHGAARHAAAAWTRTTVVPFGCMAAAAIFGVFTHSDGHN